MLADAYHSTTAGKPDEDCPLCLGAVNGIAISHGGSLESAWTDEFDDIDCCWTICCDTVFLDNRPHYTYHVRSEVRNLGLGIGYGQRSCASFRSSFCLTSHCNQSSTGLLPNGCLSCCIMQQNDRMQKNIAQTFICAYSDIPRSATVVRSSCSVNGRSAARH
jgi:hypothetical protein